MYPIRLSNAAEPNSRFNAMPRLPRESNLAWCERARGDLGSAAETAILLIGGSDIAHFRLRLAQSVARNDLSPSHWSHAALITDCGTGFGADTPVQEICLTPRRGFGWPPQRNALGTAPLGRYADARLFPNIALVAVPGRRETVLEHLAAFARKPLEVDAVTMLHAWLGFLWGVAGSRNPLEDGVGIPGAVLVDAVISRAWRDLCPGLASTAACPEAIWQAAKHWSAYQQQTAPASGTARSEDDAPNTLSGFHHVGQRLVPEDRETGEVRYCGG